MAVDDPAARPPRPEPTTSHGTAEASRLLGDERLPCGRLVTRVWEQARGTAAEEDAHTVGCRYCREAGEGLTTLEAATRGLRTQNPSARAVAERVVDAVRDECRLGRLLPLDDPAADLWIAESAAAKVLRRAADRVPGMRAASCRLTPQDGHGARVTLTMTLAATLDRPLPGRATEVRRAVAYAARHELGLAVGSIDLTVVSVLRPVEPSAPAEPAPTSGGGP